MARQIHQKTVQHYWVNIVKQKVTMGGCPTLRDTLIQKMEAVLNQNKFLTQAQALLSKAIGEHTTQQHTEVNSIIHKDHQVAPYQMPLVAFFTLNTHNRGGRFVEVVKNTQWSLSPQEVGDGLESIFEFQVQIKKHNQREYEDKWQGWPNWTDEMLATKLTKDDKLQQWSRPVTGERADAVVSDFQTTGRR